MITGFNTDIERDGVIYHVQTEDKGLDSPLILSLVYSGGEILAAKRTPYEDLITAGFDDAVLAERLKRQHRLICAAINAGRIDELKRMSSGDRATKAPAETLAEAVVNPADEFEIQLDVTQETEAVVSPIDEFEIQLDVTEEIEVVPLEVVPVYEELEIETAAYRPQQEEYTVEASSERPAVGDEFIFDPSAEILPIREWTPPPPPPVQEVEEVISDVPDILAEPTQEQSDISGRATGAGAESAYTVYDSRRAARASRKAKRKEGLELTLLDDEEFRAGETVTVRVLVQQTTATNQKPLSGVTVSIKVLGTTFRPRIQSVKTERDGVAVVSFDIPRFTSGRAAVLVRAEANEESTEVRRVILPAF